jgi:hypothetical protein
MKKDLSLWLIPKKTQELKIQTKINALATKYDAYSFIPHLTVYYFGSYSLAQNIILFIQKNITRVKPFIIDYAGIDYSDVFTKTIYMKYKLNKPLLNVYTLVHNE